MGVKINLLGITIKYTVRHISNSAASKMQKIFLVNIFQWHSWPQEV